MQYIQTERDAGVAVVKLARPKANAMDRRMLDELFAAVEDLAACHDIRAVVLASEQPKFFSSGFDVAEVFRYDRPSMTHFFGRFLDLVGKLHDLPKPTV